jgi:hypothetical protein
MTLLVRRLFLMVYVMSIVFRLFNCILFSASICGSLCVERQPSERFYCQSNMLCVCSECVFLLTT